MKLKTNPRKHASPRKHSTPIKQASKKKVQPQPNMQSKSLPVILPKSECDGNPFSSSTAESKPFSAKRVQYDTTNFPIPVSLTKFNSETLSIPENHITSELDDHSISQNLHSEVMSLNPHVISELYNSISNNKNTIKKIVIPVTVGPTKVQTSAKKSHPVIKVTSRLSSELQQNGALSKSVHTGFNEENLGSLFSLPNASNYGIEEDEPLRAEIVKSIPATASVKGNKVNKKYDNLKLCQVRPIYQIIILGIL